MENFKQSNLIINLNKSVYYLDNIKDLINLVFGEEYLKLTKEEQFKIRYKLLFPFSMEHKYLIVDSYKGIIKDSKKVEDNVNYDINKSFFIDNEVTTILSLCKINQLQILEKVDADILTKDMNKENIKGNYILLNKFVDELIKNKLNRV